MWPEVKTVTTESLDYLQQQENLQQIIMYHNIFYNRKINDSPLLMERILQPLSFYYYIKIELFIYLVHWNVLELKSTALT